MTVVYFCIFPGAHSTLNLVLVVDQRTLKPFVISPFPLCHYVLFDGGSTLSQAIVHHPKSIEEWRQVGGSCSLPCVLYLSVSPCQACCSFPCFGGHQRKGSFFLTWKPRVCKNYAWDSCLNAFAVCFSVKIDLGLHFWRSCQDHAWELLHGWNNLLPCLGGKEVLKHEAQRFLDCS